MVLRGTYLLNFSKTNVNEKNSLNGDKLYSQEIRIFTRLETRMVKQLIYT